MDPRSCQFWQMAVQGGLVQPAKMEECWQAIPPDKRSPDAIDRRLARQAVNSGLLTLWQAQQILAGRQNGLRIDRYLILDQIGQGGMGRVYLARDSRLGRQVALKVLSRERLGNARATARFRREAKVGAQLQHENLIRVYDEGDISGMPYLVMEYIRGKTVAQMIAEQGRLPPSEAAELARQVALGLEHLHLKDLLHRDVNPANILVDQDGIAKLTDLGLAIDLGDDGDIVTRDGATVGTFDYISPEQARNPRQIDTRSDLYSLGCTLYHMLTGTVPFPSSSLPEKLFAHQSSEPIPVSTIAPEVPEGLEAVVKRLMRKSPAERYARPAAVANALEPFARKSRRAAHLQIATPSSVEVSAGSSQLSPGTGSGLNPAIPGEDAAAPQAPARSPEEASPSFDWNLDLGPQPSLSESLSSTRSRSSSSHDDAFELPSWWKRTALGASAALLLGTLGALLWPSPNNAGKSRPQGPASATRPEQPSDPTRPFQVRLGADFVQNESTLTEALRRASGRTAEIVVHDNEPIRLELGAPLTFSGNITLKAARGNHPVVYVHMLKSIPFLAGTAQGSLTIEGITLRLSMAHPSDERFALIHALGNLALDRCVIQGRNLPGAVTAVRGEGPKLTIRNTWIQGFATAINRQAFPTTETTIEGSLLACENPEGWPLEIDVQTTRAGKRKLRIEQSTLVGAGLARVIHARDEGTLDVHASGNVIVGRWLLDWKGEKFPTGLAWSGERNLIDLGGDGWLAPADAGDSSGTPLGGRQHELAAWLALGPKVIKERGSQARSAELPGLAPGAKRDAPADFVPRSGDGFLEPLPGIVPSALIAPPGWDSAE